MDSYFSFDTVKPVGNDHYQKDQKMFFLYQLSLNAGQKFADSLFCLFLSGCFTQV